MLVVTIDETEQIPLADHHDFIQDNKPRRQRVFIIGGTGGARAFRVHPCDEMSYDAQGNFE